MAIAVASPPPMQSEDASSQALSCQAVQESDYQAGSSGADGMPKCACTAVNVEAVAWDCKFLRRSHCDHRKRLIDLEQIHVFNGPADSVEQFSYRGNGSGGVPGWLLAVVACALISARIGRPSRSASERRVNTSAAAPSAFADALAAVIVPLGRNAGRRVGIFSGDTFKGCSSVSTVFSPPFIGSLRGTISSTTIYSRLRRGHGSRTRWQRRPDPPW
jgi:hypothetical protein